MTLYEVLGVTCHAAIAEIKSAYRDAVKTHHPDVGGSTREFEKVQRAYFVLSNPDRRALYDQTGIEDESPVGAEEQLAHASVEVLIVQFINSNDDLAKVNVLSICKAKIERQKGLHEVNMEQLENLLCRVAALRDRLRRRDGSGGSLSNLLADREQNIRASVIKEHQNVRIADRALAMLEDYVYRTDPSPLDEDKIWAALKGARP